jgi:uncharacterized protein YndB with AHSA1/START domain
MSEEFGVVTGSETLRLERLLPGPIERVWAYLTDSEKRGKWFASGPMDLRIGGKAEFLFDHSTLSAEKTAPDRFKHDGELRFPCRITRCEPPRVLAWVDVPDTGSEVTFELAPRGKMVVLAVINRLRSRAELVDTASAWHAHLGVLVDQVEGRTPRGFWSAYLSAEAEYKKRIGEAGESAEDATNKRDDLKPRARVTHKYNATAERVFDAWLDTALIGRWMFGPALREEEIVRLSLDARVGGRFSFVVRRQGQEIDHIGRYLELTRPHRLVFTWAVAPAKDDGSRVVVEIAPFGNECELTLTHELTPEWAAYVDRTREGWTKMLTALGATLR